MDVINKFYSTMQTTVSQLSGVLPGNNVTREYEILNKVGSAGMHWKVYNGFKKTTKQEVSVFVFDKKKLEKYTKEDRDSVLHVLRRGVQQLTKIKHPRILTVQHPLEESRDSLAFATEPVLACLSDLLDTTYQAKLFHVEIIHGFQQLIDGLLFLHSDADIIHGNLSPESILINKQRSWKIFGFDFYNTKKFDINISKKYNTLGNQLTQPSLEYMAPEKLRSGENIPESDLYSLGMLMYCVCIGKSLAQFDNNNQSFRQFGMQLNSLKYADMGKVPHDLKGILESLIHPSPTCRPKLQELLQLPLFQEIGVRTLNYLDNLYQWDNLQKSKFYKGLVQLIPTFPHQVNIHSIIPHLVKEFVNLPMVPFVLPNVLLIAKMSTQKEYTDFILPHLKLVFVIDEPIQVLLILMQEMDILLKLTPSDEIKVYVLPLLYRSLEFGMIELQELCLQALPSLSSLVDFNAVNHAILPRVKKLCLKSTDISIKVKCLICIGKLLEHLDKWILLSDVLPFLEQIQNREPAIIMAIIGIHKIGVTHPKLGITADVMATKCIPFLMPFCLENSLSVAQFTLVTTIIKEMFQKVEKEQRLKLEQLSVINRDFGSAQPQSTFLSIPEACSEMKSIWIPAQQMVALKNDTTGVLYSKEYTNPLVLNRQLTTPTFASDLSEVTNENYLCENPPINYIYPAHDGVMENKANKAIHSIAQSPENSDLVSLTQQDILNFLK